MTVGAFITRVVNPCVLIEVGEIAVLTDPYFVGHRAFPMNEPIGLSPQDLPPLAAIIGGHGVLDHWHPASLAGYRHPATTPVYAATEGMARRARRAGFDRASRLEWGDRVDLGSGASVTCLGGEKVFGGLARTNHYLLSTPEISIFVGTEALSLAPLAGYARAHHVDVAVLPIDGLSVGPRRLVMDAATALEAASILGAGTLAPIHFSQRAVRGLWRCPSGIEDLLARAAGCDTPRICWGPTGTKVPLR